MSAGKFPFSTVAEFVRRNRFIPEPAAERNFVTNDRTTPLVQQGLSMLGRLVDHGLKPHHNMLDLGCGIGMLALPTTQFLTDDARYFGLDINLSGISWCHENITVHYPNFEFAVINAVNAHYGHRAEYGRESATQAVWPIPPGLQFDYACSFSLFTHLTQNEMERYIAETSLLLKHGGHFFTTWYLMNDAARKAPSPLYKFDLTQPGPTYFTDPKYSPAIAHEDAHVRRIADRHGLRAKATELGAWRKGEQGQDVIVFVKA